MSKVTVLSRLNRFNIVDLVINQLLFNKILFYSAANPSDEIMPDEQLIADVIVNQFGAGHAKDPPALDLRIAQVLIPLR